MHLESLNVNACMFSESKITFAYDTESVILILAYFEHM